MYTFLLKVSNWTYKHDSFQSFHCFIADDFLFPLFKIFFESFKKDQRIPNTIKIILKFKVWQKDYPHSRMTHLYLLCTINTHIESSMQSIQLCGSQACIEPEAAPTLRPVWSEWLWGAGCCHNSWSQAMRNWETESGRVMPQTRLVTSTSRVPERERVIERQVRQVLVLYKCKTIKHVFLGVNRLP